MKISKLKLGFIVMAFLSLSSSVWASDKMKVTITIHDAVRVGSNELAPGDYQMKWTGTGANAEVTFSKDKKVIATVPAQVVDGPTGYQRPAVHFTSDMLTGIELPNKSFTFATDTVTGGN